MKGNLKKMTEITVKKALVVFTLCVLMIWTFAGCSKNAQKQAAEKKSRGETKYMTVATPLATASMYAYWVAVAKTIQTVYPEYNLTISETQGSSEICKRIRLDDAIIGNSVSTSDYDNYFGKGVFDGSPYTDARMLWYYDYSKYAFFVSKVSGVKSWSDLAGKRVNTGGTGTSMSTITTNIFETLDITPQYFEASKSDAGDALTNRQIVGMCSSGNPDSFVMQMSATIPIDIISFTNDEIKIITEKYPYLVKTIIPAGTYSGVEYDVQTIQFLGGAQTSTALSQEDGYKFFKAVYENKSMWENSWPNAGDMLETASLSPIPLHAGAVQYLKEHGVNPPENLIPPEYNETAK